MQVEVDGVDVRDPHRVGDEASRGRSASGPDRNALLARVPDEVPDDQEVAGILHPLDHVDLVREAPLVLVDRVAERARRGQLLQPRQALLEPLSRHVLEVVVEREWRRDLEVRQEVLTLGQRDVAPFGNPHGVRERLGEVLERRGHLLRVLQEELPRLVAEPLGVAERLARADAQQDVVGMGVGVAQIVHVVGAHELELEIPRHAGQAAVDRPLLLDAMPLHLEEEVVAARGCRDRCRRPRPPACIDDAKALRPPRP